jgi:simple sugar transport system ATP-binding protein
MAPLLVLDGIVRRFGTVTALDGARFALRAGTVHALLGENGAGKTTLMRIAYGMLRPNDGRIFWAGKEIVLRTPADAIAVGIGMVQQHFALVPRLSVAENVALVLPGWRYRPRVAALAVQAGAASGLRRLDPDAKVADLSIAEQQRLEIAKCLARRARVLILDEPTSVLAPQESQELFAWLRAFRDRGGSAVLITHKLGEALALADDVTVLRHGRTVLAAARSELTEEVVLAAMLGGGDSSQAPQRRQLRVRPSHREPRVRADDIWIRSYQSREEIKGASFQLYEGELIGIAAVEGAGHRTLLRALAGRIAPWRGRLTIPAEVGFIPEDRLGEGLIPSLSLVENLALKGAGRRRGRVDWQAFRQRTADLIREYHIVAPGPSAPASALSGGNQQKLVAARELAGAPKLLVAENPTRGLDVRASNELLERLATAVANGMTLVFYSSDLDEILAISDRVLVVRDGEVREVERERDAVGRAMLGLL